MPLSRRAIFKLSACGLMLPARKAFAETLVSADKILDLTIPSPAPELVFTHADGTSGSISDFMGHPLIVNIWATWCSPCLTEMPTLDLANKALEKSGIKVIPICSDASANKTSVFDLYRLMGISSLPILMNQSTSDFQAFGGSGIPASMVLNSKHQIMATTKGAADWSTSEALKAVQRLAL
jgi:thiol-disulfide isomerase/thioredoxin